MGRRAESVDQSPFALPSLLSAAFKADMKAGAQVPIL